MNYLFLLLPLPSFRIAWCLGVAGFSAMLSLVLVDVVTLKRFIALVASQREQHNNPLKFALEIFGCVLP